MKKLTLTFAQFAIGVIFGSGLLVAGMSDPAKVLNFLDLAAIGRGWDGSLAFVLGSAVLVTYIGYQRVFTRDRPLLADRFTVPTATRLDRRILVGPAIFGVGWGLAGFCPGPALTALSLSPRPASIFVLAMFAGMAAARWLAKPRLSNIPTPS